MVKNNKIISISAYLQMLGISESVNACDLRTFLDDNGYSNLWDYPLDEIDEIVHNSLNVVLVDISHETVREVRWFELPEEV